MKLQSPGSSPKLARRVYKKKPAKGGIIDVRQRLIKDMMGSRSNESLNTEEENEEDKREGGHEM